MHICAHRPARIALVAFPLAVASLGHAATSLKRNSQWPASAAGSRVERWFADSVRAMSAVDDPGTPR